MKEFHCVVGNKGGVGKSLVASLVMQYAEDQGWGPFGIECDQSNRTLSRYERLRTKRLELLDREQQIDRRRFDALIEMLVQDDEPFVVMDNGQASFAPLTRYIVECRAFDILREADRACFVHTVIAGGQLGSSTLRGLSDTLTAFAGNAKVVVWHNDHFGPVDQRRVRAGRPARGNRRARTDPAPPLVEALRGRRSRHVAKFPHL